MKIKTVLILSFVVVAVILAGCRAQQQAPTPPQQQTQTPKAEPTPLKKGETPEQRVKEYFDAYKGKDYDKAFDLQPKFNQKRQPKDQFVQLRKSMPITDYKILPSQDKGNQRIIEVEYNLDQFGTWISSWMFEKDGAKWSAVLYQARSKQ